MLRLHIYKYSWLTEHLSNLQYLPLPPTPLLSDFILLIDIECRLNTHICTTLNAHFASSYCLRDCNRNWQNICAFYWQTTDIKINKYNQTVVCIFFIRNIFHPKEVKSKKGCKVVKLNENRLKKRHKRHTNKTKYVKSNFQEKKISRLSLKNKSCWRTVHGAKIVSALRRSFWCDITPNNKTSHGFIIEDLKTQI